MQFFGRKYLFFMMLGFFVLGCENLPEDFVPGSSVTSGIEGTMLRGPTCPVVSDKDPCPDEPFSALFHVFSGQDEVATFESDSLGHFRIELDPGRYTIVADESAPLRPPRQSKQAAVARDKFTRVTLLFDTGIL